MARKSTSKSKLPAGIKKLARRLEVHRRKANRSRKLPDDLWAAAADLAREHGVSQVCRATRLDYYTLRERVADGTSAGEESGAKFVELSGGNPFIGQAAPAAECSMELEDGFGRKMTVRAPGISPEVVELAESFWRNTE